MEGKLISTKQLKIDKANSTIVIILAVCSFVFVFSLVATKALISQYAYQNRVTNARQTTANQLTKDKQAAVSLLSSYNTFTSGTTNIIGGTTTGTSNQDGTNTKIILDALPDKYDFPALVTSIQNLISGQGVQINSITGTDTGGGATSTTTLPTTTTPAVPTTPTTSTSAVAPIPIPFSFAVIGSYSSIQSVLTNIQKSIRPIQILTLNLNGSDAQLTMTVTAQTYYMPSTGLNITSEIVK